MNRRYLLLVVMVLALVFAGCQGSSIPNIPDPGYGDGGTGGDGDGGTGGGVVNPPSTQLGALTGTVLDGASGLKLWSGTATIAGKTAQIKEGYFQVTGIPVGIHTLTVRKLYYQDRQVQISITGSTNIAEVKMTSSFSSSDLDLFARLVHAESRGEIYRGQVAVAATVLNRVNHHNYPSTLRGVITQRTSGYAQYSPIDDGSINIPASQSAKNAVRDALAGWDPSLGSTGFFAPAKVANRNNWVWKQIPVIDIGNHRFFRARID